MSASCFAKSNATKTGPRLGPSWLIPLVRTLSTWNDIQDWYPSMSWVTLLTALVRERA